MDIKPSPHPQAQTQTQTKPIPCLPSTKIPLRISPPYQSTVSVHRPRPRPSQSSPRPHNLTHPTTHPLPNPPQPFSITNHCPGPSARSTSQSPTQDSNPPIHYPITPSPSPSPAPSPAPAPPSQPLNSYTNLSRPPSQTQTPAPSPSPRSPHHHADASRARKYQAHRTRREPDISAVEDRSRTAVILRQTDRRATSGIDLRKEAWWCFRVWSVARCDWRGC